VHESEPVLRDLELTLGFAEYQVSTALTSEEALRIVAEQRIDGIVLGYDVEAPDGRSLRNLLRHLNPEMPILLFSDVDEARDIPLHIFQAYLEHPTSPQRY
jgi:DNA-binding response OmpR family regulator